MPESCLCPLVLSCRSSAGRFPERSLPLHLSLGLLPLPQLADQGALMAENAVHEGVALPNDAKVSSAQSCQLRLESFALTAALKLCGCRLKMIVCF